MSALSRLAIPRRKKVFRDQLLPDGDKLPFWSTLDLDEKLPVVPSPRGSYTLYTTSMGQPKYLNKQKYDFDLTDPYCHVRPLEYDSLHDPYLKNHFQQKRIKKHLVKNGLLTENERVICSLKEFNRYRGYIRYRNATELSLQRNREKEEFHTKDRRAVSERIERSDQLGADNWKSSSGRQSVCLLDEIRHREEDAKIRREKLRLEKEDQNRRKLMNDWENRKHRQEQKLQRITELLTSERKPKKNRNRSNSYKKSEERQE